MIDIRVEGFEARPRTEIHTHTDCQFDRTRVDEMISRPSGCRCSALVLLRIAVLERSFPC